MKLAMPDRLFLLCFLACLYVSTASTPYSEVKARFITHDCYKRSHCNDHGCIRMGQSKCDCDTGYSGNQCDHRITSGSSSCSRRDECHYHGCKIHHDCICEDGFAGSTCANRVTSGSSSCSRRDECHNHGCKIHHDCICEDGFGGSTCAIENRCVTRQNPCQHNGKCVFVEQASGHHNFRHYRCDCPAGYKGEDCQILDPCHNHNPCENNGKCVFVEHVSSFGSFGHPRHFRCECPQEFEGYTCNVRKVPLTTEKRIQITTTEALTSTPKVTTKPTTTTETTTITTTTTATAATTTINTPLTTRTYHTCIQVGILLDIGNAKVVTNKNASSCSAGDHTGSEAFVLNHCRVTSPSTWTKGYNVMSICSELPMYRAIGTFTTSNTYAPGTDTSGIFLGCLGNEIKVGLQTCQDRLVIKNFRKDGIGYENATLYYTIM